MSHLGRLLKEARTAKNLAQATVAEQDLRKTGQRLGQYEQGSADPKIDEIVRLHRRLVDEPDARRGASLLSWLAAWIEDQQARRASYFDDDDVRELDAALELLRSVVQRRKDRTATGPGISLADFPDRFLPLQLIAGDRREVSRNRLSKADLFSLSVASSDFMFLPELLCHPSFVQSPPRLWSDKIVVFMQHSDLQARLGSTNLLIIGSPAVNWASRILNQRSLFRFDIDRRWHEWDERYRGQPLRDDRTCWMFYRICDAVQRAQASQRRPDVGAIRADINPAESETAAFDAAMGVVKTLLGEPGKMSEPKQVTTAFRRGGFIDPADRAIHGLMTADYNDFGVISLAPNPWAPATSNHVAIVVGGIHGPGTTQGLKHLASAEHFVDRPYGGVIEVDVERHAAWPDRLGDAQARWQTRPYSHTELLQNLNEGLLDRKQPWAERYEESEFEDVIRFVERLQPPGDGRRRTRTS